MAVEIEGRGDPVVMVHGLGGTSNTFTPQMAVFAERRELIEILNDLPEHIGYIVSAMCRKGGREAPRKGGGRKTAKTSDE